MHLLRRGDPPDSWSIGEHSYGASLVFDLELGDHEEGGDFATGSDAWLGAHPTIVRGVEVGSAP